MEWWNHKYNKQHGIITIKIRSVCVFFYSQNKVLKGIIMIYINYILIIGEDDFTRIKNKFFESYKCKSILFY